MPVAYLAAFAVAWLTFRWLYRRRGWGRLPEIPDEDFLLRFGKRFSAPPDRVLEGRLQVSKILGVPERKLAPEYTYKDLAGRIEVLGDLGMAWESLEYRVETAARRAGAHRPPEPVGACPTVGDLVAGLIQAQVAEPPADPAR
jgi:hypothetical protein